MTSSYGNIFRVTGPLCGEFTGPGEFPTQRPATRRFVVFFDLRLNKRLSNQPWGWWFETLSWSLWRQCNVDTLSAAMAWDAWGRRRHSNVKEWVCWTKFVTASPPLKWMGYMIFMKFSRHYLQRKSKWQTFLKKKKWLGNAVILTQLSLLAAPWIPSQYV